MSEFMSFPSIDIHVLTSHFNITSMQNNAQQDYERQLVLSLNFLGL